MMLDAIALLFVSLVIQKRRQYVVPDSCQEHGGDCNVPSLWHVQAPDSQQWENEEEQVSRDIADALKNN